MTDARTRWVVWALCVLGGAAGCAQSQRPVVSMNDHAKSVGIEVVHADIDRCIENSEREAPFGYRGSEQVAEAMLCMAGSAARLASSDNDAETAREGFGVMNDSHGICDFSEDEVARAIANECLSDLGYRVLLWR